MKTIVVAVDFSEGMKNVVIAAKKMAQALGERIYLVHVIDDTPIHSMYGMYAEELPPMIEYRDKAKEATKKKLMELKDSLEGDCVQVLAETLEGRPQDMIQEFALNVNADMVVVGTHGHSAIGSMLMGSVASSLVRKAKFPVLVVPC